jgi:hypothetical protein
MQYTVLDVRICSGNRRRPFLPWLNTDLGGFGYEPGNNVSVYPSIKLYSTLSIRDDSSGVGGTCQSERFVAFTLQQN